MKEQLIFTLATIKVEVQLKKRVHAHALWSRTKFKTTKIFSCMFSFIDSKICTNENFPLYGIFKSELVTLYMYRMVGGRQFDLY